MSKEKLILDTMCWYTIGGGKHKQLNDVVKAFELVGSYVSLREMLKSPLLITNFLFAQRGIASYIEKTAHIEKLNPFFHMAFLSGFDVSERHEEEGKQFIELAISTSKAQSPSWPEAFKKDFYDRYDRLVLVEKEGTDQINEGAANSKKTLNQSQLMTYDFGPHLRNWLTQIVENACNYQEGTITIDWKQFELLEKTFTALYTDMVKTGRRLRKNDIHDLLQLAYVQPGMKYFTYENNWVKFIELADCNDYLLPQTDALIDENKQKSKEMHSN